MRVVDVFRTCMASGIGAGLGGVMWLGIPATEVRAALSVMRIARVDWPDVAEDVQYMGRVVADERNRRAAADAKSRRKR